MVKLYISADLEGVNGVVSPRQCDWASPDRSAYEGAVDQLTREVGAVVRGALEGGATYILINDSHYTMTNLTLAGLRKIDAIANGPVEWISGKPKPCAMSAGLDSSFDGIAMVGYHPKAGTAQAVLCHTFHDGLYDVRVNGVSYGEGGINALHGSLTYGVPTVLASGDTALCQEMTTLLPGLATVATKESLSFSCARNFPAHQVEAELYTQAKTLVQRQAANPQAWAGGLLKQPAPYRLEIDFLSTLAADLAVCVPNIERISGRSIAITCKDFQELYLYLQTLYSLLAYQKTL